MGSCRNDWKSEEALKVLCAHTNLLHPFSAKNNRSLFAKISVTRPDGSSLEPYEPRTPHHSREIVKNEVEESISRRSPPISVSTRDATLGRNKAHM